MATSTSWAVRGVHHLTGSQAVCRGVGGEGCRTLRTTEGVRNAPRQQAQQCVAGVHHLTGSQAVCMCVGGGGMPYIAHDRGQVREVNLPEGVRNGHVNELSSAWRASPDWQPGSVHVCVGGGMPYIAHDRGQVREANLPEGVRNGHVNELSSAWRS